MSKAFFIKQNRDRNKPMAKQKGEQLAESVAAYDRILKVSTEIRKQAGLPPVDDGQIITGARRRLTEAPKVKRKAVAAPKTPETPQDAIRALARRREALEAERAAVEAETARLVSLAQSEKGITVSGIARALGLSRQRLYQVAGA